MTHYEQGKNLKMSLIEFHRWHQVTTDEQGTPHTRKMITSEFKNRSFSNPVRNWYQIEDLKNTDKFLWKGQSQKDKLLDIKNTRRQELGLVQQLDALNCK
jgi:hypothetical protein